MCVFFFCCCCFFVVVVFLLIFFVKTYVVGTQVSMQRLYKEVDKKYTGNNLKTTELLDCGPIRVCVVIRLNTVYM